MNPSPPSVRCNEVVFAFGQARQIPLVIAAAAASDVSVPLNLSGAIKTRIGFLSENAGSLRSFRMDVIEAPVARDASESLRKVYVNLIVALRLIIRLTLGDDIAPSALFVLRSIIFHATNRARGVIFTNVHPPSLSLR